MIMVGSTSSLRVSALASDMCSLGQMEEANEGQRFIGMFYSIHLFNHLKMKNLSMIFRENNSPDVRANLFEKNSKYWPN